MERKFFVVLALMLLSSVFTSCQYDDGDLWDKLNSLEQQVDANKEDIATLTSLVEALNKGKVIVSTTQTENGYTLTFSDGSSINITNGKDGDSFFVSIVEQDDMVIITLADGRVIKLPVISYELRVLTFEDADAKFTPYELYGGTAINTWSDLVDDAQYGGKLTYTDYSNDVYYWHDEGNTELYHSFSTPYWGGGHVISNYVTENYETLPDGYWGWYELQMSTPIGGHNGSANFAVHNGYRDFFNSQIYDASLAGFEFADGVERVVDHMYVTNTNYVLNSITYGDGFNSAATEDTWLKVTAYGYNANGESVGSLEFDLCNGYSNILKTWQKWDLSALGKVARVVFNFSASEDQIGSYGLNCPAYFAYDDVAVRFEK